MNNKINITPTTSVYSQFKFRTYKVYKALAEYIDNSTQSYFDNKKELLKRNKDYKLVIELDYTSDQIILKDNAFGMSEKEFFKALVLGEVPKDNSGRNKFGMGLKTASCWFSDLWSIESTTLGCKKSFKSNFDVPYVSENGVTELEVFSSKVGKEEHWTKVTLSKLHKKITGKAAYSLSNMLAQVYRNDLKTGEIEIYINGELVKYSKPKVWELIEGDDRYKESQLEKDFNFVIEHNGIDHNITGCVAIADKGSTSEFIYGLDFMRNGRVIIPNVKDEKFQGKTNSFSYQRLFGEVNLDSFGVMQDKADFDWHDGLREKVIEQLSVEISGIRLLANKLRKREKMPITNQTIDEVRENLTSKGKAVVEITDKDIIPEAKNNMSGTVNLFVGKILEINKTVYKYDVNLVEDLSDDQFVSSDIKGGDEKYLIINICRNHKFLLPRLGDTDSIINIVNVIVAMEFSRYTLTRLNINLDKVDSYSRSFAISFRKILGGL